MDAATIIGYVLFIVSELLPFLPLNTNGIFETLVNGFQKSFGNVDADITLAKQLISSHDLAAIVNTLATNPSLRDCVHNIISNQSLVQQVNTITGHPELQKLLYSINSDQVLLNKVRNLVSLPENTVIPIDTKE
jgi:hypothetical protein